MPIYYNSLTGALNSYIEGYLQFRYSRGYMDTNPILSTLRSLDRFLKDKQIKSVREINQRIILEWFGQQHKHRPQGRRQRLSGINNFFKYLQRICVIKNNPVTGIIIKGSKYTPYIYNLKEICDILSEAKKLTEKPSDVYQGELYYTLIYILFAMGLRLNEALNIRLKDINFKEKTIFIYKGKFAKERLLPFSKNTALKLKQFLKLRLKIYPPVNYEEPLFCNRHHKCYAKGTIEVQFRKFTRDCGLIKPGEKPPRLHDIRHTFASNFLYKLYNEGKDVLNKLPILSQYMGHIDVSSTEVYLTVSNTLFRKANERFENKFANIINKKYS